MSQPLLQVLWDCFKVSSCDHCNCHPFLKQGLGVHHIFLSYFYFIHAHSVLVFCPRLNYQFVFFFFIIFTSSVSSLYLYDWSLWLKFSFLYNFQRIKTRQVDCIRQLCCWLSHLFTLAILLGVIYSDFYIILMALFWAMITSDLVSI